MTLFSWDDLEVSEVYNFAFALILFCFKSLEERQHLAFTPSARILPFKHIATNHLSSYVRILRTGSLIYFLGRIIKSFENLKAAIMIPSPTSTTTTHKSKQITYNFSGQDHSGAYSWPSRRASEKAAYSKPRALLKIRMFSKDGLKAFFKKSLAQRKLEKKNNAEQQK